MTFEKIKHLLDMTDDPATRLEILMDIGRELPNVPSDAVCTEITGCTSFVQICDLEKMFADLKINVGAARLNGVNSMIRFFKNL